MKKLLSIGLVVIFAVSSLSAPVSGAETLTPAENNEAVAQKAKELEDKYGILITYPANSEGNASITLNNLETLDRAFSTITAPVIKQLSSYYNKLNGHKIDINYMFSSDGFNYDSGVLMAAFERTTSKIYVFLPPKAGKVLISGENPIALVHELGHAFHTMCSELYGSKKLRTEWEKFNGKYKYHTPVYFNPDEKVFVSTYSSTMYEEDFAETFAHTFIRNVAGTGFSESFTQKSLTEKNAKTKTGLGKKVEYIEKLLPLYFDNSEQAVANYRKIYNTPASMKYEGISFSGEQLQYIGYPQPKNVLKGVLNYFEITSEKSTWLRDLGAWRVVDTSGDTYYVFPGGDCVAASSGKKVA